ncbi:MAG: dipeptide ABC transporter ATP-binding protein [Gammaproteobacteria bacterium]|nr:dipeptide ABC transporter ATP-binding protein [Gammaproteobacteria bacterium]
MSDSLLSVEHLSTCFDGPRGRAMAVDGISFDIRKGETFALLGESGCGKSVTSLSLMRLVPEPAGRILSGRVLLGGQDLMLLPERAMRKIRGRRIAMIFQEPMTSLNPVLTIGDQIAEGVRIHLDLRGAAARRKVLELLDAVGIPDPEQRIDEYPHQLSGGMKQRVMIAIALSGEPELLIADEPTTALDVTIQAQVLALLRDLQARTGMAILLITHDLGVVAEMADRVGVMYAGQLVEIADREPFFAQPAHPYSRKLFESLPNIEKRDTALATIPGSVPSLTKAFSGCRFADRCAFAWTHCREVVPDWTDVGDGQRARCHLLELRFAARERAEPILPAGTHQSAALHRGRLLEVNDLKVHFPIQRGLFQRTVGHVYAVDGVDLKLDRGRTLALVGESGCGKTTIGKAILQLIRPTAGEVLFEGDDLTRLHGETLRRRRDAFQIIFQDPFSSMNPRMRVHEIIEEGMVALNIERDVQRRLERVRQLLSQVGLPEDAGDRYPHEFSGGQRQRICIARALAVSPRLLVCDEPTSALDISVQAQILNLLKDLQGDMGLSYLFITHNLSVVAYLADEVAVMYLGRIVERGTTREVLHEARHPYTRALLSAIPEIDGAGEEARAVIRLQGDLPSPSAPPVGCHFHTRCPEAMPRCKEAYPGVSRFSVSHEARCFLYEQGRDDDNEG